MINVVSRHCEEPNCKTQPSFAMPGERGARYCAAHMREDMVDVRSRQCQADGCSSIWPNFAMEGEPRGRLCASHKTSGMVDVRNKRCEATGCIERAYYGAPGDRVSTCSDHMLDGYINRPSARCDFETCREPATHGASRPDRCGAHRRPEDDNLVERKCASCGLIFRLCAKGLCMYCREGPRARLVKQREVKYGLERVLRPEELWQSYDKVTPGISECHDRERPDFFWDCDSHVLILEVDEDQHKGRPEFCECARMLNIAADECRPAFFVRYNPDAFVSPFASSKDWNLRRRLDELVRVLRSMLARESPPMPDASEGQAFVLQMFFDGFSPRLLNIWHSVTASTSSSSASSSGLA